MPYWRARYGFQQSDQVGFGLTAAAGVLGLLLMGLPGAAFGGIIGNRVTQEVRSVRRQQSGKLEPAEKEEEGEEVDWVVDCLVNNMVGRSRLTLL